MSSRWSLSRWMDRFVQRMVNRAYETRELQRRADTSRIFTLFQIREAVRRQGLDEIVDELTIDTTTFPAVEDQLQFNEDYAREQVMTLIQRRDLPSFRVVAVPSVIQDAGIGLAIHGTAVPGSVVALYPGRSYAPADARKIPGYPNISKDNSFLMSRSLDEYIIDAKCYANQRKWEEINEWALGQYVNHPPKGMHPNVILCPVQLDTSAWSRLTMARVPWVAMTYAETNPSFTDKWLRARDPPGVIRGLALVARRQVSDEELFLNYRLNPRSAALPNWYHDPEPHESEKRWALKR
mmetsp:Transcript_11192/g.22291  ORF Transcript_11192/g.22291 Transcript_11192/m.22291 type:complete len:295 (-) Transcript_11192:670-1554(-)